MNSQKIMKLMDNLLKLINFNLKGTGKNEVDNLEELKSDMIKKYSEIVEWRELLFEFESSKMPGFFKFFDLKLKKHASRRESFLKWMPITCTLCTLTLSIINNLRTFHII